MILKTLKLRLSFRGCKQKIQTGILYPESRTRLVPREPKFFELFKRLTKVPVSGAENNASGHAPAAGCDAYVTSRWVFMRVRGGSRDALAVAAVRGRGKSRDETRPSPAGHDRYKSAFNVAAATLSLEHTMLLYDGGYRARRESHRVRPTFLLLSSSRPFYRAFAYVVCITHSCPYVSARACVCVRRLSPSSVYRTVRVLTWVLVRARTLRR